MERIARLSVFKAATFESSGSSCGVPFCLRGELLLLLFSGRVFCPSFFVRGALVLVLSSRHVFVCPGLASPEEPL